MKNVTVLESENLLLRSQLYELKQHLAGSAALQEAVDDVRQNDVIYCTEENIHGIVAGLIRAAKTYIEIGPGLTPQRLVVAKSHIMIEADNGNANLLTRQYSSRLILKSEAKDQLKKLCNGSVDIITIFNDLDKMDKDAGLDLVHEACRIARKQVVIRVEYGKSSLKHTDFTNAIAIIANSSKDAGKNEGFFYAIIEPKSDGTAKQKRVVLLSEVPTDFTYNTDDIIIADIAFSELGCTANNIPKHNCIYVPLKLIALNRNEPIDALRSTVINFNQLEEYIRRAEHVAPIGLAAKEVLHIVRSNHADT